MFSICLIRYSVFQGSFIIRILTCKFIIYMKKMFREKIVMKKIVMKGMPFYSDDVE